MLNSFDELGRGKIAPSFKEMVSPQWPASHQEYVERIGAAEDGNFPVFGLDFYAPKTVYQPTLASSSIFLIRATMESARQADKVLELGAGCGVIGLTLLHQQRCRELVLSDINPLAIAASAINVRRLAPDLQKSVTIIESDLFAAVPLSGYDLIIFNLPLLHSGSVSADELALADLHGQLARRFFHEAAPFLNDAGEIHFIYSNLSDPRILEEARRLWDFSLISAEFSASQGIWKWAYRGRKKTG